MLDKILALWDWIAVMYNGQVIDSEGVEEMENAAVYILKWEFSPSDYFEEKFTINCKGFQISVDNGQVEAHMEDISACN